MDLLGMRYILEVLHLSTITAFSSIAYLGFLGQHGLHTVLLLWAAAVSLLSLLTMSFGDKEIMKDLGREPSITLPHLLKARNFTLKRVSESSQPVF